MKDFYNKSLDTMVDALQMNLTEGWFDDVSHWENCANKKATCANDYAIESIHLSCSYAHKEVVQNITEVSVYIHSSTVKTKDFGLLYNRNSCQFCVRFPLLISPNRHEFGLQA